MPGFAFMSVRFLVPVGVFPFMVGYGFCVVRIMVVPGFVIVS